MAAAAAVAAAGGADVPLAAQHQQASPPIQQQHLELQQQQEQAEQPAHSQPQQEELIPSGSRQQPASATTAGLTAVELGTARLLCAVRSGRSIGESILQPQVTAWQKEAQRTACGPPMIPLNLCQNRRVHAHATLRCLRRHWRS